MSSRTVPQFPVTFRPFLFFDIDQCLSFLFTLIVPWPQRPHVMFSHVYKLIHEFWWTSLITDLAKSLLVLEIFLPCQFYLFLEINFIHLLFIDIKIFRSFSFFYQLLQQNLYRLLCWCFSILHRYLCPVVLYSGILLHQWKFIYIYTYPGIYVKQFSCGMLFLPPSSCLQYILAVYGHLRYICWVDCFTACVTFKYPHITIYKCKSIQVVCQSWTLLI